MRYRFFYSGGIMSMPGKIQGDGQGLVEYSLIIVLVAIALIVGLNLLGSGLVGGFFNNIISAL
jgi:Flp pilus assembly pilin Flp